MIRNLIILALGACAVPVHSMTASVTPGAPPAAAPTATGNAAAASKSATSATPASVAAPDARPGAGPGKPATPAAPAVTQPAAVLSAPGVPARANAARPATARSGQKPYMPGVGAPDGTVQSPPARIAPAAVATDSAGMRKGTLEAVNVAAGTFSVYGQKLDFNPQRVRIFNRDGKPGSAFDLTSGAKVRFTLDATDPARRRVSVIYVD